jgi:hypothetical protein
MSKNSKNYINEELKCLTENIETVENMIKETVCEELKEMLDLLIYSKQILMDGTDVERDNICFKLPKLYIKIYELQKKGN